MGKVWPLHASTEGDSKQRKELYISDLGDLDNYQYAIENNVSVICGDISKHPFEYLKGYIRDASSYENVQYLVHFKQCLEN